MYNLSAQDKVKHWGNLCRIQKTSKGRSDKGETCKCSSVYVVGRAGRVLLSVQKKNVITFSIYCLDEGKMREGGWHTNNNMQDNSLFQGLMFSPLLVFRTFFLSFIMN